MPRSYHALGHDWTPLSRNLCWLSNVVHRAESYMRRNSYGWFHELVNCRQWLPLTIPKLTVLLDKSFVDDLVYTGYCKCESSLCTTRHWDLSRVPWFVLPVFSFTVLGFCLREFGPLWTLTLKSRGGHFPFRIFLVWFVSLSRKGVTVGALRPENERVANRRTPQDLKIA